MKTLRFAHVIALSLFAMTAGCSGSESDLPDLGAGAGAMKSAGYGYEMLTDRITPTSAPVPEATTPAANPDKRLAPEVVRDVVRASFGPMKACYEKALATDATLEGEIAVRFVVREDGAVEQVRRERSSIKDAAMVQCVAGVFGALHFPVSGGGNAEVIYPIQFAPSETR